MSTTITRLPTASVTATYSRLPFGSAQSASTLAAGPDPMPMVPTRSAVTSMTATSMRSCAPRPA
ncbi:hypothetical protein [Mycobacterium sp. SMC-8]|uniref:hypothetical protein n=1 Tax=Mycobacterium sp. SMC-8 TaxID=2857060 RepID=UPI0021B36FED|nr:hypothetical protein [Mycobacterium sp. SMC-8]